MVQSSKVQYDVCMIVFLSDCEEGDIHLVGGSVPDEGIVVLCLGSLWGMVAYDEYWDVEEAMVVCSQLGYESAGTVQIKNSKVRSTFCP